MEEKATGVVVFLFLSIYLLFSFLYFTPFSLLFNPNNSEDYEVFLSTFSDQNNDEQSRLDMPVPATFDEKDVVVLTDKNFSDFVAKNQYVLLNFYASWCYWSQKLAPEYAAAASMLKSKSINATLSKVDCTQELELCRKFMIQGYPTVYLFVDGSRKVLYDYHEQRTRDAIVNWVDLKINNHVQNLTTVEEAERILAEKPLLVLGFLDSLEGPESVELAAVPKLHIDVNFYQTTNAEIAKLFHIDDQIKTPALLMSNREDNAHFAHEGQFTRLEIAQFVSTYKLPSVITFTADDASKIFENPMKQMWLFAPVWGQTDVKCIFREAAHPFKGKVLFVHVEIGNGNDKDASVGRELAYKFGVTELDAPRVVAYYRTSEGATEKHMYNGELSSSGIKSFAEEFVEGKLVEKADIPAMNKLVIRLPLPSHSYDPSSLPHSY